MSKRKRLRKTLKDADLEGDLKVEPSISLRTHESRLELTEIIMVEFLEGTLGPTDAKVCFQAIEVASRMQERVDKSEAQVAQVILQLGENVKEDLRDELEEKLKDFEVQ